LNNSAILTELSENGLIILKTLTEKIWWDCFGYYAV